MRPFRSIAQDLEGLLPAEDLLQIIRADRLVTRLILDREAFSSLSLIHESSFCEEVSSQINDTLFDVLGEIPDA